MTANVSRGTFVRFHSFAPFTKFALGRRANDEVISNSEKCTGKNGLPRHPEALAMTMLLLLSFRIWRHVSHLPGRLNSGSDDMFPPTREALFRIWRHVRQMRNHPLGMDSSVRFPPGSGRSRERKSAFPRRDCNRPLAQAIGRPRRSGYSLKIHQIFSDKR